MTDRVRGDAIGAPRRVPIVSTLIVGVAVAVMIALGLWQLLDRLPQKEAFLSQLATNPAKPAIAFPRASDQTLLFRRASGVCLEPVSITLTGAGSSGFRAIAECRTGVEGPGMVVQLGTTRDPRAKVSWGGGPVTGRIANAPGGRSLIGSLFDRTPPRMMLVADPPLAGLSPNTPPRIDSIPNSHLAYAGQWFFFAIVATIIYVLAIRRRQA